ncbi:MAG: beta-lactamase family protein, partial [Candidatus Hydrogenedentes bacterium]|nr:beta-lactamase family protein [Candidatus Hydrogenedentota bacterium]
LTWEECIERICDTPLEEGWVIGETAGYHQSTSWYILGELVRRIDGRAFSDYVREAIFEPLGMSGSSIGMTEAQYEEWSPRIGITYATDKGFAERLPLDEREFCLMCRPGGSGRGPIRELGLFYEMLLNGGEGNSARLLNPETVAEFTRPHRVGQFDETFRHKMDWGLGFIVDSNRYGVQTVPYGYGKRCSPRTFGHGGYQSTAGFADPEHGLVVAVAFNGTAGEPKHAKRIRDFATAVYEDLGLGADGAPA